MFSLKQKKRAAFSKLASTRVALAHLCTEACEDGSRPPPASAPCIGRACAWRVRPAEKPLPPVVSCAPPGCHRLLHHPGPRPLCFAPAAASIGRRQRVPCLLLSGALGQCIAKRARAAHHHYCRSVAQCRLLLLRPLRELLPSELRPAGRGRLGVVQAVRGRRRKHPGHCSAGGRGRYTGVGRLQRCCGNSGAVLVSGTACSLPQPLPRLLGHSRHAAPGDPRLVGQRLAVEGRRHAAQHTLLVEERRRGAPRPQGCTSRRG